MKKTVVVGLSGGVDSSVAAYILKQQGYHVIGLFMKNWHDTEVTLSADCPWLEDSNDALLVAEKLGIPFQTVDLSEEYKHKIVDYMFAEYKNGRTPNPDVLCNREIKFDVFLKIALSLGADFVATGHYCQKGETTNSTGQKMFRLLESKDTTKDQTYFLCQITQNQLSKILFPIGNMEKSEVRQIATKIGLVTAKKKDSQGLCFIGKVSLPEFLQQKLQKKTGDIIEIPNHTIPNKNQTLLNQTQKKFYVKEDGRKVGEHFGAHFFTKGQRKGLHVGGMKEPLYVLDTDVKQNIIYVGQGKSHQGLYRKGVFVHKEEVHWLREDLKIEVDESKEIKARIRYRQKLENALMYKVKQGLIILFENPQFAAAEGQFVAWYQNGELLGSGVISQLEE